MFNIDILKSHTVRVNGGSGVLVKPLSPNVFYILTAYHCISKNTEEISISFASGIYKDVIPDIIYPCYYDKNTDAAIIVIKRFCDSVHYIGFTDYQGLYAVDFPHIGYPKCREDEDDGSRLIANRSVNHLLGNNGPFVEYEYAKNTTKDEIEGMSGGGIFDQNYHLLGLHKQSVIEDDRELLGHALFIPCCHFQKIISDNNLPEILEFDLATFNDIKNDIFDFSQMQGAKNKAQSLLFSLAIKLGQIVDLSPRELYKAFNDARNGCKPVPFEKLLKHDWASFGEFVLVSSIMLNADVKLELDKIMNEFQYVHSDKDFDLQEAANELNLNIVGFVKPNVKIVVGGIHDSGLPNDVVSYNLTPDIANALPLEGFDVAKSPRQLMQVFTYVNANLYKEIIIQRCNEIQDCEEEKLEFYISIIRKMIYG